MTEIDYRWESINVAEYKEKGDQKETEFLFITNLAITRKNIKNLIERGRWRWKIGNQGFNTQKNHGYHLGHMYSQNYQGIKNHCYLIQIGHMIARIVEAWEALWKKVRQSMEQKHRRLPEAWKTEPLTECLEETGRKFQMRFI